VNNRVLAYSDSGYGALLAGVRLNDTKFLIGRLVIQAMRINGDLGSSKTTTRFRIARDRGHGVVRTQMLRRCLQVIHQR
jgi:hypothetical protein